MITVDRTGKTDALMADTLMADDTALNSLEERAVAEMSEALSRRRP
jgi:hypothetical protein